MRSAVDSLALHMARLGPVGLVPKAPGTAASAVATLAAPWLFLPLPVGWRLILLTALFLLGSLTADRAARLMGSSDPSCVVIDELVGQWLALLPLSSPVWSNTGLTGLPLLAGFLLFRFFDIFKPGPVRSSEGWLPGGWGIMIDDVVGGLLAMLLLAAGLGLLWPELVMQ